MAQYVDPIVTKSKFKNEIDNYIKNEHLYRNLGVICTGINFEENSIMLLFAASNLKFNPIVFSILIDYSNWDVEPPSVKFINPFSHELLKRNEIHIQFYQKKNEIVRILPNGSIAEPDILQGSPDAVPFLCIPGVKEYHDHPAHTGDFWMLLREKGEGKLCTLIEQIYNHSINQIGGYMINLNPFIAGFQTDIRKL